MAGKTEFRPGKIVTTLKRGATATEKVTLTLTGPEGGDYHIEPGPKPQYDERWADPDPDGFRLGHNHRAEDIAVKLSVPRDAKFGTHHFRLIAQNEDEPVDNAAVDVAVNVPVETPVPMWLIILVILAVIALIVFFAVRRAGGSAGAPAEAEMLGYARAALALAGLG